jgi:hypothetical protein
MFGETIFFCSQPLHQWSLHSVRKLCPLTCAQTILFFCVTLKCNKSCSNIFLFLTAYFVLDKYLHGMLVTMLVYFCSWYNMVRNNKMYLCYNLLWLADTLIIMTVIHVLCLCNNNLLQYTAMCMDLLFFANIFPENIYCFCITIIFDQISFDQINCLVIFACIFIFLFSNMNLTVCQLSMYILVLYYYTI